MTDSNGKKCPLCVENGLMKTIIVEDDVAYLCRRVEVIDGHPVVMKNEYMAVLKSHVEGDWFTCLYKQALVLAERAGITPDNLSSNMTSEGGRQLDHPHIHLIVRTDGRQLGMNGLIAALDKSTQEKTELELWIAELREEVAQLEANLMEARRKAGVQLNGF